MTTSHSYFQLYISTIYINCRSSTTKGHNFNLCAIDCWRVYGYIYIYLFIVYIVSCNWGLTAWRLNMNYSCQFHHSKYHLFIYYFYILHMKYIRYLYITWYYELNAIQVSQQLFQFFNTETSHRVVKDKNRYTFKHPGRHVLTRHER